MQRHLPEDMNALKKLVLEQSEALKQKDDRIVHCEQEISYLETLLKIKQHKLFGPSSEKYVDPTPLFNETEETAEKEEKESAESFVKGHTRKRGKRRPLPECLEREDVIVDLPEDERVCPHDGSLLEKIGEEVSEQLDIVPAKMKVIRTIRYKYACKTCEESILTAPAPARAIPKSIASAGLLAHIAASKYVDGLPLYRLEKILFRSGIDIMRGSMARWMIKISELFRPLLNLMQDDLLESTVVHADETTVQVLKESGKKAESKSYMWVRCRSGPDYPIILFDYDPSRSKTAADNLLRGFEGYLQVDGYGGYNGVCENSNVKRVGCWAHTRRYFFEALKASPKQAGKASEALAFIKRLYKVEKKCSGKKAEAIFEIRQKESKPILDEMNEWLTRNISSMPPKTATGKAFHYLENEWSNLVRYIENGSIDIDNNFAENAIRPFVVGRKNWLFSDTVNGANASAAIYSIVETAKANKIEPYEYLRFLLEEIPKASCLEDYETLLPIPYKNRSNS